jgi:ribonuclease G
MAFLMKLWESIKERSEKKGSPSLIHAEMDLTIRALRDFFTNEVKRVLIDSKLDYERAQDFARNYLPSLSDRIELYQGIEPIFDAYGIEIEIDKALGKKVWLKSGGYIVIDQTEAMVVIDVNTGKYLGKRNIEETILKTNLEAANEIAYQMTLRNLGGIIVIDFIDMERENSRQKVLHAMENAIKKDRARTNILGFSELGLLMMTRKRIRESLSQTLCEPCFYCDGKGTIKSHSTICYDIFKEIERVAGKRPGQKIQLVVHPEIGDLLYEEENGSLEELERIFSKRINIKTDKEFHLEEFEVTVM